MANQVIEINHMVIAWFKLNLNFGQSEVPGKFALRIAFLAGTWVNPKQMLEVDA